MGYVGQNETGWRKKLSTTFSYVIGKNYKSTKSAHLSKIVPLLQPDDSLKLVSKPEICLKHKEWSVMWIYKREMQACCVIRRLNY